MAKGAKINCRRIFPYIQNVSNSMILKIPFKNVTEDIKDNVVKLLINRTQRTWPDYAGAIVSIKLDDIVNVLNLIDRRHRFEFFTVKNRAFVKRSSFKCKQYEDKTEFCSLPKVWYQEGLNGERIDIWSNFRWVVSIGRIQLVVCHHSYVSVFLPRLWSMELSNLCCSTPLLDLKEKLTQVKVHGKIMYTLLYIKRNMKAIVFMHFACRFILINKRLMTQKGLITDTYLEWT